MIKILLISFILAIGVSLYAEKIKKHLVLVNDREFNVIYQNYYYEQEDTIRFVITFKNFNDNPILVLKNYSYYPNRQFVVSEENKIFQFSHGGHFNNYHWHKIFGECILLESGDSLEISFGIEFYYMINTDYQAFFDVEILIGYIEYDSNYNFMLTNSDSSDMRLEDNIDFIKFINELYSDIRIIELGPARVFINNQNSDFHPEFIKRKE